MRSRVSAIDGVVRARVARALKARIVAAESRRAAPGSAGTHWYALRAPPRSLFEHAIQHLRRFVPRGDTYAGAEWWFRATSTDTGFPFHFDRDEGIRSRIVSPALASILYLSSAGGPTVILDADPSRTAAPRAGVAVYPRPGRFAVFSGELLHGVLPERPSRWPRVTLLVNWWRSVPRMEPAPVLRDQGPARVRWGPPATTPAVALDVIDPARLLAKAAWRELIAKQASYR